MRPRVFPAEDLALITFNDSEGFASMRPRVFPAEDAGIQGEEAGTALLQ